jgi:hypothetical protein
MSLLPSAVSEDEREHWLPIRGHAHPLVHDAVYPFPEIPT